MNKYVTLPLFSNRLTLDNLRDALWAAESFSSQELMDGCFNFMHNNFAAMVFNTMLKKLSLSVFLNLLRKPARVSKIEEHKFLAMIDWVEFDANRCEHLNDLLGTFSVTRLKLNFIMDQLASKSTVANNPTARLFN